MVAKKVVKAISAVSSMPGPDQGLDYRLLP